MYDPREVEEEKDKKKWEEEHKKEELGEFTNLVKKALYFWEKVWKDVVVKHNAYQEHPILVKEEGPNSKIPNYVEIYPVY